MVPVLDHAQSAGTQPRKERFERSARLVEAVRGIVNDQAQRLAAEIIVKDRRQSLTVRLVDAVVQPNALAEPPLRDQLVECFNAVWLEVDGDELPRGSDQRVSAALPPEAIPSSTKFSAGKRSRISRYPAIRPGCFWIENSRPRESSNPQRNSTSPTRKCGVAPDSDGRDSDARYSRSAVS